MIHDGSLDKKINIFSVQGFQIFVLYILKI